jgi:hypothetical protein
MYRQHEFQANFTEWLPTANFLLDRSELAGRSADWSATIDEI